MSEKQLATIITNTPTLETGAYADGDRMGSIEELTNVHSDNAGVVMLKSIVVLDKDDLALAMDIMFFDELPTVASADNAAISITDAEMAKCIGYHVVAAADFADIVTSQVASIDGLNKIMRPATGTASTSLWTLLVSRAAPTHTASGLVIKYCFERYYEGR